MVAAAPAGAHQSPPGCNSGTANVSFGSNDLNVIHRNGDVISVVARYSNAATACDVTDATITVQFPNPDGTFNGPTVVVATGLDVPHSTPLTALPAVQHTVNFNPAVFRGPVNITMTGTKHFTDPDTTGLVAGLTANLSISQPHATLNVTPTPASGGPPLNVSYAYSLTNDSAHDSNSGAADPNIDSPALSDDRCSPVVRDPAPFGDTNNNTVVDLGETWTYHCTKNFPSAGLFTNHVTLNGNSTRDGRPWPTTTAQSTVTVNGPDMTLAKTHTGDFTQGDTGKTYSLVATNVGNAPGSGTVSVADTLPTGLTATAISGTGWTCTLGTLTCTRSDALGAGASYPPITVTVDVARDAPATVINTAAVSRAGDNTENDGASDPTTIAPRPADTTPGTGDTGAGGGVGGGGGGGGVGGGGGFITPPDLTPPAFSAARMTNRTFAVDPKGAGEPVVSARAKKGTAFAYTLSEDARALFTIEQKTTGRTVGGKCVKATRRNARARRCSLFTRRGAFGQDGKAGQNVKPWSGKLGSKALKPGAYRASIAATDATGNKTPQPKQLSFKIVRR
jgi:uncharacterized repeat protein (TIGR01451 family)